MNIRTALLLAALAASPLAADAQTTLRRTVDRMPSFDPVQSESVGAMRCVTLVYETLLEYDYLARPYRLRGGLAEGLPEISADGRTITLARFGPGDIFGELAMFDDEKRSATVEVVEDTEVVGILGSDMDIAKMLMTVATVARNGVVQANSPSNPTNEVPQ